MCKPFILGINYWPRQKAMYWWARFDEGEVREEFQIIKNTGFKMVRIFLLWEDWQPAPNTVSRSSLENLEKVCNIAADLGLSLNITFFTGHMSGPSWTPEWMLNREIPKPAHIRQVVCRQKPVEHGYFNHYEDGRVKKAAELLLQSVVSRFKSHPAVGLWNLGNEPGYFAKPPDASGGRKWVGRMLSLIREMDEVHPVTCGLDISDLSQDNGLRIHDVFSQTDIAVMHGYPMYADWADGPLDPDFVPFLCSLTAALCGKPVLAEEFGGCTEAPGKPSSVWSWTCYGEAREQFMASEEAYADYIQQVLPRLLKTGATGAVLWCFSDYVPELYKYPPCDESWHERHFGLVRPDGSLKPHADVIKRFAEKNPSVQPADNKVVLDITAEEYYRSPLEHMKRLYADFKKAVR